jgi:hypothetical protein
MSSNNRQDILSYSDITANYRPIPESKRSWWGYNISKFQIDSQVAPSYMRLPDGTEFIACWLQMNPLGHQVVVVERTRHAERMFNPKGLPLELRLDPATGHHLISVTPNGEDRLTDPRGGQRLYPIAQCDPAAADLVANSPKNLQNGRKLTDDGAFWTYEYHNVATMADYPELENHFRDFRTWVTLHEARAASGFGIGVSLESGSEAHADEIAEACGL